jgi:hypothetical protein
MNDFNKTHVWTRYLQLILLTREYIKNDYAH